MASLLKELGPMGACCAQDYADLWTKWNVQEDDPEGWQYRATQLVLNEPVQILKTRGPWAYVLAAHYSAPGWVRMSDLGPTTRVPWYTCGQAAKMTPLQAAYAYYGKAPYLWGGMSPEGVDCSGLVNMAYRLCGKIIPRDAHLQEMAGIWVDDPQEGDLITFVARGCNPQRDEPAHVGFWLPGKRILHSVWRDENDHGVREENIGDLLSRRRGIFRIAC